MATVDLYVDNEDSTGAWSTAGSPPYLSTQNQPTDYIYDTGRNNNSGVYSFESSTDLGTINSVYLHLYVYGVAASDFNAIVSASDAGNAAVAGSWQWRTPIDVSSILTTWAQINAATVYFDRPNTENDAGVDCAFLRVDYTPGDLSVSVDDTITSSDVIGRSLPLSGISRSDTITVDELIKLFQSIAPSLFDSITINDFAEAYISISASASDTVTVDDVVDVDKEQLDRDFSVSDTITLSDILSVYISISSSISDTITVDELTRLLVSVEPRLSDIVTVDELVKLFVSLGIGVSDTVTLSDVVDLYVSVSVGLSNSITVDDIVSMVLKLPGISRFDTVSITDEAQANISSVSDVSVSREDAVTIVENVVARIPVSISSFDTINIIDQALMRMSVSTGVDDYILVSEFVDLILFVSPITKNVSDTVSIVEQALARLLLNPYVSDAVNVVENVVMAFNLPGISLADIISISDSVVANITVPNKGVLTGRVVLRVPKIQFAVSNG